MFWVLGNTIYKANNSKKAIIRQKRPIASDRAKPKMAYEKSCCFNEGLRAYPMMREPKTDPIPAPMNLAAESISFFCVVVVRARLPIMTCWAKRGDFCHCEMMLLEQFILAMRAR